MPAYIYYGRQCSSNWSRIQLVSFGLTGVVDSSFTCRQFWDVGPSDPTWLQPAGSGLSFPCRIRSSFLPQASSVCRPLTIWPCVGYSDTCGHQGCQGYNPSKYGHVGYNLAAKTHHDQEGSPLESPQVAFRVFKARACW